VTSQDVADAAGVSRTTVSLVLNNVEGIQISEETRQKVVAIARELGYVPDAAARALASRRAQIIGLVLTRSPHHITSDAFLTQILDGLIGIVHAHGLRLLIDIVEPQHQKEAYLQLVRSKHIDGLILSGPRFDDEALQDLEEQSFPTVLMGQLPGTNICSVDVDNCTAAQMAVEHLISLGHERIACITNASPSYTAAADRLNGYRDALHASGLPYDENLVRYGDFSLQSGYRQMQSLLDSDVQFTAAFVASDEVLIGALRLGTDWEDVVPPPDTTEVLFSRGDVNTDGTMNIADAVALLGNLFGGAPAPPCSAIIASSQSVTTKSRSLTKK
jgi:LacI family transcriptional regulator